jgi:hypothetical protein
VCNLHSVSSMLTDVHVALKLWLSYPQSPVSATQHSVFSMFTDLQLFYNCGKISTDSGESKVKFHILVVRSSDL